MANEITELFGFPNSGREGVFRNPHEKQSKPFFAYFAGHFSLNPVEIVVRLVSRLRMRAIVQRTKCPAGHVGIPREEVYYDLILPIIGREIKNAEDAIAKFGTIGEKKVFV